MRYFGIHSCICGVLLVWALSAVGTAVPSTHRLIATIQGGLTDVQADSTEVAEAALATIRQQQMRDSLYMLFVKTPDPSRPNQLADSLLALITVKNGDFMSWVAYANTLKRTAHADMKKTSREPWVLIGFGVLILFFGLIRFSFPVETVTIIEAFYNDRTLAQINKEDTLYSSWPFVFLFVLFGFSLGLFFYLYALYYLQNTAIRGVESFFLFSIFILLLFGVKIMLTRIIGYIFGEARLAREYISVLYLSYFNVALIFLPLILILSLIPHETMRPMIWLSFIIMALTITFRLLKTANNILNKYQFPKFYLFVYLCCLEIAPILILVKVLGQ